MTSFPIEVGGVRLKNPSSYSMQYKDLDSDNSYTNLTGVLVRDMIRSNHRTIDVSWNRLTTKELSDILKRCTGQSQYTIRFFDFYSGDWDTSTFYPSDRKSDAKIIKPDLKGLFTLSLSFIEF